MRLIESWVAALHLRRSWAQRQRRQRLIPSPNQKRKFALKFPKQPVLTVLAALILCAVAIYSFLVRDPHPPGDIVISTCRDLAPGIRRITSDFGIHFDVSERAFTVNAATNDMPPERFYVLRLKDSAAVMVIAHDDGIWDDLKNAFPVFSRRIEERTIRTANRRSIGTDHRAYLRSGERWRYVRFSTGDAVGYRPIPPKEAELFDQVIGSACH